MFSNIEYGSNLQNLHSKDLLELPANLAKVSHPSVVWKCCKILNIFYSWITWCFNTIRPTCCIFLSFPCFFFLGQSSENTYVNRLRLSKNMWSVKCWIKVLKGIYKVKFTLLMPHQIRLISWLHINLFVEYSCTTPESCFGVTRIIKGSI